MIKPGLFFPHLSITFRCSVLSDKSHPSLKSCVSGYEVVLVAHLGDSGR